MKKIPLWKNIVLIGGVLVIIIIATFAWFYTGTNATVGEVSLSVGKATYVQISGDSGENWSEELDIEIGINKNFKEMSGDGSSLFVPVYEFDEDAAATQILSFAPVSQENGNEFYYEEIFDFRADSIQNVYLAPESYVNAVNAQGNSYADSEQLDSYIDGAIRVAFFALDNEGNETLIYIWAPNSTVEYSNDTLSFTREGTVEPYYYYQKSTTFVDPHSQTASNSHVTVIPTANQTDENGCGYSQAHKFLWTSGENMPENAPPVLTLNVPGDDKHYIGQLKVRVWLEGYDRECVSLLSGQRFTMKLQFDAQEVDNG